MTAATKPAELTSHVAPAETAQQLVERLGCPLKKKGGY